MKRYAIIVAALMALTASGRAGLQKDQDLLNPDKALQPSSDLIQPKDSENLRQRDTTSEDKFSSEPAETDTGRTELKGAIIPEQPSEQPDVGTPGLNEEKGTATQSSESKTQTDNKAAESANPELQPELPNSQPYDTDRIDLDRSVRPDDVNKDVLPPPDDFKPVQPE